LNVTQSKGLLFSFIVGMIAVICMYRVGAWLGWFEGFLGWGVGALVFLFAATSVPFLFPKGTWASVALILAGIPFGVSADATYDFFVNHRDRNLFPFEIVLWCFFTFIPTIVGYSIGRFFFVGIAARQAKHVGPTKSDAKFVH
jgi:hypothetical protein